MTSTQSGKKERKIKKEERNFTFTGDIFCPKCKSRNCKHVEKTTKNIIENMNKPKKLEITSDTSPSHQDKKNTFVEKTLKEFQISFGNGEKNNETISGYLGDAQSFIKSSLHAQLTEIRKRLPKKSHKNIYSVTEPEYYEEQKYRNKLLDEILKVIDGLE